MKVLGALILLMGSLAFADVPILDAYHSAQTALANDEFENAHASANALVRAAKAWIGGASSTDPQLSNVKTLLSGA